MKKQSLSLAVAICTLLFCGIFFSSCDDCFNKKDKTLVSSTTAKSGVSNTISNLPVDYGVTVEEAIKKGDYSYTCHRAKNNVFTHEKSAGVDTLNGVLLPFKSMQEAQKLQDTTLRPATIKELSALGLQLQKKKFDDDRAIFAIGSKEHTEGEDYSPLLLTEDHSFRTNSWKDGRWDNKNKYFFFIKKTQSNSLLVQK